MTQNNDLVTLIANNLAALPHPNGDLLQFIQYATLPGSTEQQQQQTNTINNLVATAIINLLITNGYTLTRTPDA